MKGIYWRGRVSERGDAMMEEHDAPSRNNTLKSLGCEPVCAFSEELGKRAVISNVSIIAIETRQCRPR
jgi:hypothetical protein